jgi:hypothetical protein
MFPPYLRADAQGLLTRWAIGDYEASLFRGIKSTKETWANGKSRISNSTVDKEYKFLKSAKVFGDCVVVIKTRQLVDLINGQWFTNRACAYRDGAHGELEAGVCGEKGEGAYSIVLANAGYADEDHGEESFFSYKRGMPLRREDHGSNDVGRNMFSVCHIYVALEHTTIPIKQLQLFHFSWAEESRPDYQDRGRT